METNENFFTPEEKNKEESDDKLIVRYVMKYCGCPDILLLIFPFIFLPIFFLFHTTTPYKQIIKIEKANNILMIYFTGLIPCCKLSPRKSYNLTDIEKIRIYVYSIPHPTIGFTKLYFINCEIYSINGDKEILFSDVKYDKDTFERFVSFFKKHFKTEIETIETAKDKSEYNINDVNNMYPEDQDLIVSKP